MLQKNKRGRPPGSGLKPETSPVRLPVETIEAVDAYIASLPDPKPSRPAAIAQLLALAIKAAAAGLKIG